MEGQVLTQNEVNDLYKMFKHLVYNLNKYAIHYCITDGTLLGAVRHGGLIPWDDDIDIAIERKDLPLILHLKYIFESNGKYKFVKVGKYMKLKKDNIWIDIFLLDDGAFPQKTFSNLSFKEQEYKPFKTIKFGDIDVSVPNLYIEYLDRIFDGWRDTAYIYNHKNKSKKKISLTDELKKPLLPCVKETT
jgi:phosphorylcholine metabolism protein LicD